MAFDGDNCFENCDKLWQSYSDYKKALYLTNNPSDCCFLITTRTENPKKFLAHKWILKCASSKFESIFNENLKEIPLTDVEPHVFKKFLDFIYYGDTDNLHCADVATLKNLIDLSKQYEIDSLKDNCIKMMKENLDKCENYDLIGIFEYACLMEDSELVNECKRIIVGRANSKLKFSDCNLNKPLEEKHDTIKVRKDLMEIQGNTKTSSTNSTELNNAGGLNAFGSSSTASCNFPQAQQGVTTDANVSTGSNIFGSSSFSSLGKSAFKPVFAGPNSKNNENMFGNVNMPGGKSASSSDTAFGVTQANNQINVVTAFSQAGQSPNNRSEEKIQNTEKNVKNVKKKPLVNIFNTGSFMPVGLCKGNITKCSYIYQLEPSIFYEFQNTLSGYIPEIERFDLIETYAKINGLNSDHHKDDQDSYKNNNNDSNEEKQQLPKAIHLLNMMLHSIKFLRMSAKEFTAGPGKSTLLDTTEKYDILENIVNIN